MPAELTERAERMMKDLPAYYHDDPNVRAVVAARASEFERIEGTIQQLRDSIFPALATGGMLELWERQMRLPVAPPGVSEDDRRDAVRAVRRTTSSGSVPAWVAALTRVIGPNFTYEENTPGGYQLTLTIPYGSSSLSAGAIERIARRITPANIDLVVGFQEGFIVGVSTPGEPLL